MAMFFAWNRAIYNSIHHLNFMAFPQVADNEDDAQNNINPDDIEDVDDIEFWKVDYDSNSKYKKIIWINKN